MMAAFAEGLALSDQLGLSKQDVLDVVALGAINSPMFALKGPNMAKVCCALCVCVCVWVSVGCGLGAG